MTVNNEVFLFVAPLRRSDFFFQTSGVFQHDPAAAFISQLASGRCVGVWKS
jgi:hypothetical protein